jgi:hypothetical protein
MRRLWGVALGLIIGGTLYASDTALRTPNGMLWAGTTFVLQATVSQGTTLLSMSEQAQVRVGQVYRWQMQAMPPAGQSISSGSGLFAFRVTNLGNGYDSPQFIGWQEELTETQVWQIMLFEDRNGSGVVDSGDVQINGQGSPLMPAQGMTYLLRATPPSSSTPTDGVWLGVATRSVSSSGGYLTAEYVAGALRSLNPHSRGYAYSGYVMNVPAVFYEGRVFWMGTDSSNRTRIFYTPNRIDQPGGTLSNNRALYGLTLNFIPSGFSVVVGNGWFVGTSDGRLLRLDLARILSGDTSSVPAQQVNLPSGVQPRLDLPPVVFNSRLYVVGSDNRLHALSSAGIWLTQSGRPSSAVGAVSCPPLLTSRTIVVGTANGYVVVFDLVTGGIRWARQVGTEPVRSVVITRDERYLLVQVGNSRLMAITSAQGTTYWLVNLPDGVVSPLAYDVFTDSVLLLTRSGWLYAFHGATGTSRPHYPQQLFTGQPIPRATIATLRRADRKSPYAYVLAQQELSGSSATQARMAMVTILNPYNRYDVPESQMGSQAEYLPAIAFTGDAVGSLCLVCQKQAYAGSNTQGIVVAFPVQ